ncbi:MAG: endonuclease/exonuclease/phosphatase family protein [Burkholderiales bacterium]|nr:endonuclease/exonuclease/phosphatase family protein [Burkholderiales bacterium]
MALAVATYNVHRCIGADGRRDPQRVLAVLRELDADVVALQELEWHPAAALDLLEDFARALGCAGVASPTLLAQTGHYGNAVLTRLPVRAVNRVDLSVPGREPRGALDLRLDTPHGSLRVIATHLGLAPAERRSQVRRILGLLAPVRAEPVVLMGDLNEWFLWGRTLQWVRAHFGRAPAPATFPARWPLFALDRIWVEPRTLRRALATHANARARAASDHLPLRMTLVWPGVQSAPAAL